MADATSSGLQPNLSSYQGYDATNKLLATATNTPQAASDWINVARQGQALTAAQFDLSQKHLSAMNGLASSALADPTEANATARIGDGVKMGVITPESADQELATVKSFGGDQKKIAQWAYQHLGTVMSVQQLMQQRYGDPGTLDNGQTITPVVTRTGPQAGVYAAGGNSLQKYMSPGEASAPQSYEDSTGRMIHTTTRGYGQGVGDTAGLPPAMGAAAPAPQPAAGGSGVGSPSSYVDPNRAAKYGASIVNGRAVYGGTGAPPPPGTQPGDVTNPGPIGGRAGTNSRGPTIAGGGVAQPQPQGGGAPQPTVSGFAGPTPGVADAAKITGAASAEQGVSLQKAADGAPVRKAMLANLNDDLDHFTSGPGADWQQVGKAWANRNVLPTSMQFDPQSIASQEGFNKQATQLAQQQFQALGGTGTDSQLSSTFKANPNQALSQLGNRQIIQLLRGNEDALQAKSSAWQQWQQQNGSSTYGQFQQDFNKTYNPRVYQAMYMDPTQIADMRKNMNPTEQQQFARDYVALKAKGYITPGGSNAQR